MFAGPASLVAIVAVAGHGRTQGEVLDLLAALAEKSLLVVDATDDEPRYRMLESTRSYASDKLGLEAASICEQHARHFAARLAYAGVQWETTVSDVWLAQYSTDLDQIRAALEWSFGPAGQASVGLELVANSHLVWSELGLALEHRHWVSKALEALSSDIAPAIRARVLSWQAGDIRDMDDPSDYDDAILAAGLHGAAGNTFGQGQMLLRAGSLRLLVNHEETERLLEQARTLLLPFGKTKSLARCLSTLASARMFAGDMDAAQAFHRQAVEMIGASQELNRG